MGTAGSVHSQLSDAQGIARVSHVLCALDGCDRALAVVHTASAPNSPCTYVKKRKMFYHAFVLLET